MNLTVLLLMGIFVVLVLDLAFGCIFRTKG